VGGGATRGGGGGGGRGGGGGGGARGGGGGGKQTHNHQQPPTATTNTNKPKTHTTNSPNTILPHTTPPTTPPTQHPHPQTKQHPPNNTHSTNPHPPPPHPTNHPNHQTPPPSPQPNKPNNPPPPPPPPPPPGPRELELLRRRRHQWRVPGGPGGLAALAAPDGEDAARHSGVGTPIVNACRAVGAALGAGWSSRPSLQRRPGPLICRGASGVQFRAQVNLGLDCGRPDAARCSRSLPRATNPSPAAAAGALHAQSTRARDRSPSTGQEPPGSPTGACPLQDARRRGVTPGDPRAILHATPDERHPRAVTWNCRGCSEWRRAIIAVVSDDSPRAERSQLGVLAPSDAIGLSAGVFQCVQGVGPWCA